MTRAKLLNAAVGGVIAASTLGFASAAYAKSDDTRTNKAAIKANGKVAMLQSIATAEGLGSAGTPAISHDRSRRQSVEGLMRLRLANVPVSTSLALAPSTVTVGSMVASSAVAQDAAVAPERNPPGDIPDNQVFIQYQSPLGFSIKVPEGWSRQERADGARFSDKYNIIDLAVSKTDQAPNPALATTRETVELKKMGRAVEIRSVKEMKLKSGPAVLISYASNSEPNPVTNKVIRLEHNRYLMFKKGTLVSLDLSAPVGADNADQWQLMSNSFEWQ
jgi:hypothetical protein